MRRRAASPACPRVAREHARAPNALERALILADGAPISAEQLGIVPLVSPGRHSGAVTIEETETGTEPGTLAQQERHMIVDALPHANGNSLGRLPILGLSRFPSSCGVSTATGGGGQSPDHLGPAPGTTR